MKHLIILLFLLSSICISQVVSGPGFGYDYTNSNWHFWDGADLIVAPLASGFVTGHCPQLLISAGVYTFADSGSACAGGTVSSVFGRTGAVVAATNDYSFSQVSGTVAQSQSWPGVPNGTDSSITANVYTVTLSPAPVAYVANQTFGCFKPHANNTTTTPTLSFNGLLATTIVKMTGVAVTTNDLTSSETSCVIYDGTNMLLLNPQAQTGSGKAVYNTSPTFSTGITTPSIILSSILISNTAPTLTGFGTTPSIVSNNGTAAFTINVGTGGTASSGTITFPTASHGWVVHCDDVTTQSTSVSQTQQTAVTTTTAVVTQYSDVHVATAWAASDILVCQASAY